jgi:hypothetical protein
MYLGVTASNPENRRIMINTASQKQCRPIDITGIVAMYCTTGK